jgi:two-component system, LytTR family, response regulator
MQIAICDDDPMIIKELQKDLEQYFRKHHLSCPPISQFTSGESLLNNKEDKDIVFLDVEMRHGRYVKSWSILCKGGRRNA